MSRAYDISVRVISKKITLKELEHIITTKFGWTQNDTFSNSPDDNTFCGSGTLYGGMGEEAAHKQISEHIKRRDAKAKVQTTWTYLEELPYETYGDEMED